MSEVIDSHARYLIFQALNSTDWFLLVMLEASLSAT